MTLTDSFEKDLFQNSIDFISGVIQKSRKKIISQYTEPKACIGHINFQVTVLSPVKMMTASTPPETLGVGETYQQGYPGGWRVQGD
jgi:hypothetical protein